MYSRKKRGFSFTFEGTKYLVWFSTDEHRHTDCVIADEKGNQLSRGVAYCWGDDEFNIIEGEDIAYDYAEYRFLEKMTQSISRKYNKDMTKLVRLKRVMNTRIIKHLDNEENLLNMRVKQSEISS